MKDFEGHTPGPWFVHDFTDVEWDVSVSCTHPDHITVAVMGLALTATHEEALANARLIAASPDLLAENERLRDYVERLTGFAIRYASPSALDAGGRALIEEARAALQEAE